nr:MAG TPA: hypothetical protein [Caudoviricetes sp.]
MGLFLCPYCSLAATKIWRMPSSDLALVENLDVLTNRKSIRFFCIRTQRFWEMSKHRVLCNK